MNTKFMFFSISSIIYMNSSNYVRKVVNRLDSSQSHGFENIF